MTATRVAPQQEIDAAYQAQRLRLTATVTQHAAAAFAAHRRDPVTALRIIIPVVTAGQKHTVALVDAYMAAKARDTIGVGSVIGMDAALYTTETLRGISAAQVYGRAFAALYAYEKERDAEQALAGATSSLDKLVRTDLQLAQTHSARDWMTQQADTLRIVGWRRVLTGPGPHCALCEAASTRTYGISDLMPIHEHCGCTVEPLWGEHAVSSVGTTVRVEEDPEIGPRLMADSWQSVGPRVL